MSDAHRISRAALVSRPPDRRDAPSQYLVLTPEGRALWTSDPEAATSFESMREAMRASLRLPAGLRAFGLPRDIEYATRAMVH